MSSGSSSSIVLDLTNDNESSPETNPSRKRNALSDSSDDDEAVSLFDRLKRLRRQNNTSKDKEENNDERPQTVNVKTNVYSTRGLKGEQAKENISNAHLSLNSIVGSQDNESWSKSSSSSSSISKNKDSLREQSNFVKTNASSSKSSASSSTSKENDAYLRELANGVKVKPVNII